MPNPLKIVLATLAVALLAGALAYVIDGHDAHRRAAAERGEPAPEEPAAGFDAYEAPDTFVGNAVAIGSGASADDVDPEPAREQPPPRVARRGTPGTPGPSIGADPARADTPLFIANPTRRWLVEATAEEGTGSGDGDEPRAPGDRPAGPSAEPELQFFDRVDRAWSNTAASLADCAAGLPTDTRDSIFVEFTVGENFETRGVGAPRVDSFQSTVLTGDREVCARRAVTTERFPAPWEAYTGEGPSYTVRSESRIEYTVQFEFEVGRD